MLSWHIRTSYHIRTYCNRFIDQEKKISVLHIQVLTVGLKVETKLCMNTSCRYKHASRQ